MTDVAIIGAGLAGCECALSLARAGIAVSLFEQKPLYRSPAHFDDGLAELVCSNSLRSDEESSGVGLLKREMRTLGSEFMACADAVRVPSDKALAVDRAAFSAEMTRRIVNNPKIQLIHKRIDSLDDPEIHANARLALIIAAGPLASEGLSASLASITGREYCYFYDAIAPIVWTESLDMSIVFRASRYGHEQGHATGEGDYLNCPMTQEEYSAFYEALCQGKTISAHAFEKEVHFEGCMPIEALAQRGPRTLCFGPLKPVGFLDPRSGRRPWAVLQLRAENLNTTACNLVGCQTKLLHSEQERIFRIVPGLNNAEFARFGSMHRNTYINAPECLGADLSLNGSPKTFLAGQICGVEGYVESVASGLWLGLLLSARAKGIDLTPPPEESALGALLGHLRKATRKFQPSNIHFGLMPPLALPLRKKERKTLYATRAKEAFNAWLELNKASLLYRLKQS